MDTVLTLFYANNYSLANITFYWLRHNSMGVLDPISYDLLMIVFISLGNNLCSECRFLVSGELLLILLLGNG